MKCHSICNLTLKHLREQNTYIHRYRQSQYDKMLTTVESKEWVYGFSVFFFLLCVCVCVRAYLKFFIIKSVRKNKMA